MKEKIDAKKTRVKVLIRNQCEIDDSIDKNNIDDNLMLNIQTLKTKL